MAPVKKIFRLLLALILLVNGARLFAKAPDQTNMEKALVENRFYLYNVNIAVSNYGSAEDKADLQQANNHDFLARLWFLQGQYPKSNVEVQKSQELLKEIYYRILRLYIQQTKNMLEASAKDIISSRDAVAQHYLQLGFRDLKNARDFLDTGYNYSRLLYSNKINIYIEGIKRIRRGKRYAILSMIEAKTPRQEKTEYKKQTLNEVLNPDPDKIVQSDYDRVRTRLINLFNRKILASSVKTPEEELILLDQHDDNYAIISKSKNSLLDTTNVSVDFAKYDDPNLEENKALDMNRDIVREREVAKAKKKKEAPPTEGTNAPGNSGNPAPAKP